MLQFIKTRMDRVTARLHKAWHAERIPCWTEYLQQTAERD